MPEQDSKFRHVPLSEIARPVSRPIAVVPGESYRTFGVKWWGEGAYERATIDGSETSAQTLFLIRRNDLVINKIWVRHGSVAIAGSNVDGCAASGEFPTFEINQSLVLPRWIHWYSKIKRFWEACDRLSQGTSGKNRITARRFLEVEIPLPPLAEQQRIVSRIEALAARIEEAKGLRAGAMGEVEAVMGAARRNHLGAIPGKDWVKLSSFVAAIENGTSPQCEKRRADINEWGVVKVGVVSFGYFRAEENKVLPIAVEPQRQFEIRPGDFLMSRANTRELVGACAVVKDTRPKLLLSDKIFRFVFQDDAQIDLGYLEHALKSPVVREQIEQQATGTSPSMKNISKQKVLGLVIPKHPLWEQHRIVAHLDELQAKVEAVKRLQAETQAELAALLPAVLDRAFRGEL